MWILRKFGGFARCGHSPSACTSLGLRLRQSCAGNRIALLGCWVGQRSQIGQRILAPHGHVGRWWQLQPAAARSSGAVAAAAVRRNSIARSRVDWQAFGAEFPEPADWADLQLDRSTWKLLGRATMLRPGPGKVVLWLSGAEEGRVQHRHVA